MFHICPVSLGNCRVNSELSGRCGRTTEISYHKLWTHVNSPASSAVTLVILLGPSRLSGRGYESALLAGLIVKQKKM